MKKYTFCFLLFGVTSTVCLSAGYLITRNSLEPETTSMTELAIEETTEESQAVVNQDMVEPLAGIKQPYQYYLVSEDGYLLVLYQDEESTCLYTHMPIMDFPEEERAKLMEGIWFPSMIEVFNYLESYTS